MLADQTFAPTTVPAPVIYRKAALLQMLGVSASWIEREVAEGRFPRPIRLSKRAVGWLSADVTTFLVAKAAERDAAA